MPVLHRVFAGERKRLYLRKDGRLGWQKSALTAQSQRQRIGYQMLADETGAAFVDLYPVVESKKPRLELVYAFLALAWSAPVAYEKPRRELGLPDVLSVPGTAVSSQAWTELQELGRKLDFRLERPRSGFDAGPHLVKQLNTTVNDVMLVDGAMDVDWADAKNMRLLSYHAAGVISSRLRANASLRALYAGAFHSTPAYKHRPMPPGWLSEIAHIHGASESEFKDACALYFAEGAPAL